MSPMNIKEKLLETLRMIQETSGLECPEITGNTKPVLELKEFDSKMWPVAMGYLSAHMGVEIPDDVNIFKDKKNGQCIPLTIDQTVSKSLRSDK